MESFRTFIKGKFGKVLLVIFILPFAFFGLEGAIRSLQPQPTVASMKGYKISQSTFEQAYNSQKADVLRQLGGDAAKLNEDALRQQIIKSMADRYLLAKQAAKIGITVGDAQISQLIAAEPTFQTDGQFDPELFKRFLLSRNQTKDDLMAEVRQTILTQSLVQGIQQSGFASHEEVKGALDLVFEQRLIDFASIPLTASTAVISDKQISDYYQAHQQGFALSAQADVSYMALDQLALQNSLQPISDQDLKAAYAQKQSAAAVDAQKHVAHILIETAALSDSEAQKKINQIYAQYEKGITFDALAKQYSQDPGSADQGGDLGFAKVFIADAPEFNKTVSTLRVGQVSKPVKTKYGYHLIKLLGVQQSSLPPFAEYQTTLRTELAKTQLENKYQDLINQINEAAVDADQLEDLAKTFHLTIQNSGVLGMAGNAQISNSDLLNLIFSDESVRDQRVLSGVSISPTQTVWAKIHDYKPARTKNLTEVKPQILDALRREAAIQATTKTAQLAVNEINQGKTLAEVSAKYHVQFARSGFVTRQQLGVMANSVFSIAKPAAGKLRAGVVIQNDIGRVLIAVVNAVKTEQPADFDAAALQTQISTVYAANELSDYIQYLYKHYNLEIKAPKLDEDENANPK